MNDNRIMDISTNPNRYNEDYSSLSDDTIIKYGDAWDMVCTKEEFIRYQQALLELKNKYKFSELSPLEKLMAAYNIAKSKPYYMTNDESLNGLPHALLFSDNIDCRGYCNLMIELLAGEGITIKPLQLDVFDKEGNVIDGHMIISSIIDDPKYGIHGLYVTDPTGDSYKPQYKEYFEGMEETDLYSGFLKPIYEPSLYSTDQYEFRIPYANPDKELSTKKVCYDNPETRISDLVSNYELDDISFFLEDGIDNLFEGLSKEEILNNINTSYLSFETLLEVITNLKRNEGLSEEKIQEDIKRISNINDPYFIRGNEQGRTI